MNRRSKLKVQEQIAVYGSEDGVICAALQVLAGRMAGNKTVLSDPQTVKTYLTLSLASLPHEEFWVLYLDAQNRVIASESLFRGTLSQTSVYPREIVKRALHFNAGAVIFAHNHPSGVSEPSYADESLTKALQQALKLVDVRVLDHFVVGGVSVCSFAERGLI